MPHPGFHRVVASDELPAPEPVCAEEDAAGRFEWDPAIREVTVGGQRVLVTRLPSGEAVAFARSCPHLGTPLHRATLCGEAIRCAQHRYAYDARTGQNVVPAENVSPEELRRLRPGSLQTYPVIEQEGWVWVSEEPQPPVSG